MNQNHYYKILILISIFVISNNILYGKVHKPSGDEEKIMLNIKGKERSYYKLDNNGLKYKSIGKKFEKEDSIRIGIFARSIKAPSGKKKRNYGFSVQIDGGNMKKLKYRKEGSKVTSKERPGWNYTEPGIWYIYLPYKKDGYSIKVKPLKGNPVVYIRLASNSLEKKGKYSEVLKSVNNNNDRWRIETSTELNQIKDLKTTYWYPLENNDQQQYEILGPATVKVFSRIKFDKDLDSMDYYLRIREDGYDIGTYFFKSEKSILSKLAKTDSPLSKWRSIWLNIPKGKHYYTFTLPDIDGNMDNTVYIRIKKWEKE